MPRRTVRARVSEAMEKPRAGSGAPGQRAPFPPSPGQEKPGPARPAGNVAPHGERVRVRVADPEHRSQEREEPGEKVPRAASKAAAGADAPPSQGHDVLFRLAER